MTEALPVVAAVIAAALGVCEAIRTARQVGLILGVAAGIIVAGGCYLLIMALAEIWFGGYSPAPFQTTLLLVVWPLAFTAFVAARSSLAAGVVGGGFAFLLGQWMFIAIYGLAK
ncbi:hypothetical protein M8R20_07415 [Pseudomonas sp. R2.Fl]|nr:hypothetical protein [Pseudomonas sp. R2.Fl]